jgi:hypothetical protein
VASVTGITAAKALEILGMSVVSGVINGSGHLILTRDNGQTIDAGDFTAIVTGILSDQVAAAITAQNIPNQVSTSVKNAMAGTLFNLGSTVSGAVDFDGAGATVDTLVNAIFTATLTGNITIDAATAFPANPKPGTQFAFRIKQDATGGRTLTLTGIKKSNGVLTLTTTANATDVIVFFYDGTSWYAGAMGLAFS